ncbi:MAG TPA: TIGR04053 family radical SAM/SPASM domain-containing protein [Candidatus Polarisedimenticolia bacterium]|nr:TIGR04053 family radical SAM/SPASM domain-containing protein [Candidatus Polarisedimenticolia bacterium]
MIPSGQAGAGRPFRPPSLPVRTLDYGRAPLLVIWEVTRACDLACVHCRASALPRRDPEELTLAQARGMFAAIRAMGTRLLVLTGGDPLKRPDLFELIASARSAGLDPSLSPSATPLLTGEALRAGRAAGLSAVSLSLDGAGALTHDAFRGVSGSFDRTLAMAGRVVESGLDLRINTTVTSRNLHELPEVARLAGHLRARIWSVFFLVPTGRAGAALQIGSGQCESVLGWLYELSSTAPFRIKTTEAPHYRRVVLEAMAARQGVSVETVLQNTRSGRGRFLPGMNDGRGIAFISHRGEVYPSGFLPLSAGSVRDTDVSLLYRDSVLFRGLREPDSLRGRCGRCRFRAICGGSRARAYAHGGDPLGEDHLCDYEPESCGPAAPHHGEAHGGARDE